ncbi:hypothetical protein RHGRI_006342 [Rhododendron griersonianum]|uniref:DUF4283 domain-containing protein n=1 Tax=Rhododendron griersonianum TaxID=479676 RepID=A0AAV6KSL8_9ERIC|nr:hypothetical protein RHGRI_006342 [Rhododendron griersonianum]
MREKQLELQHTMSRKGYARLTAELKEKRNVASISRAVVWANGHRDKNGKPKNKNVAQKIVKAMAHSLFVGDDVLMSMIEGPEVNWLGNFFEEFRPWSPDFKIEASRTVWLSCFGVPLHAWNSHTSFSIGRSWGEPITLDNYTSRGLSFSSGKLQISTNFFGAINQEINVEVNGRLYPIRVVEEQFVVNNMMRGVCKCKCNGSVSINSKNLVSDKEEDDWIDTPAKDNHLAD